MTFLVLHSTETWLPINLRVLLFSLFSVVQSMIKLRVISRLYRIFLHPYIKAAASQQQRSLQDLSRIEMWAFLNMLEDTVSIMCSLAHFSFFFFIFFSAKIIVSQFNRSLLYKTYWTLCCYISAVRRKIFFKYIFLSLLYIFPQNF